VGVSYLSQWEGLLSSECEKINARVQDKQTHTQKHVFVCINNEEFSLTSIVYILQNIFFDYPVAYIFFHFYIFTLKMLFFVLFISTDELGDFNTIRIKHVFLAQI